MKNKDEEIELDNMEPGDWRFEPWPAVWNMLPSKSAILPNGLSSENDSADSLGYALIPKACSHEPIDVGFNKVKLVCKICDKDL